MSTTTVPTPSPAPAASAGAISERERRAAQETARVLQAELDARLDGEVRFDRSSRMLYSTDASNYQIEPVGVVLPRSMDDAIGAIELAASHGVPRRLPRTRAPPASPSSPRPRPPAALRRAGRSASSRTRRSVRISCRSCVRTTGTSRRPPRSSTRRAAISTKSWNSTGSSRKSTGNLQLPTSNFRLPTAKKSAVPPAVLGSWKLVVGS